MEKKQDLELRVDSLEKNAASDRAFMEVRVHKSNVDIVLKIQGYLGCDNDGLKVDV